MHWEGTYSIVLAFFGIWRECWRLPTHLVSCASYTQRNLYNPRQFLPIVTAMLSAFSWTVWFLLPYRSIPTIWCLEWSRKWALPWQMSRANTWIFPLHWATGFSNLSQIWSLFLSFSTRLPIQGSSHRNIKSTSTRHSNFPLSRSVQFAAES